MKQIPGRYIGENIRLISDVLDLTDKQQIPGILVALDFCKAFDSLKSPFIMETLNLHRHKIMDQYILYQHRERSEKLWIFN